MSPNETHLRRAQYVRTILAWHGLSQADLARILGCSQQSASFKLSAKRRFSADDVAALADHFGIEAGAILKPPELEPVLGAVRMSAPDLLTCTKYQLPLIRALELVAA